MGRLRAARWIQVIAASAGVALAISAASFVAVVESRADRLPHEPKPLVWLPPSELPTPAPPSPAPSPPPESELPSPPVLTGEYPVGPGAGVIYFLRTSQRAVFITIDDGWQRDPRVLDLIRRTNLPVTLFLTDRPVEAGGIDYFRQMARAGAMIENHTMTHPRLPRLGYDAQRSEICRTEARYKELFGHRPTLFRPPYGAWNRATLRAAADCGIGAVVNWDATMGGGVLLTYGGRPLQPGDIVLLHFRPDLYDDLLRLMRMLHDRNLGVGLLEDFLRFEPASAKPPSPSPPSVESGSPAASSPSSPNASHDPSPSPSPSPTVTPSPSPAATPSPSFSQTPSPSPSGEQTAGPG